MSTEKDRRPRVAFLLRKSKETKEAIVLRADDFPFSVHHNGKNYRVIRTRKGGIQMLAE